MTCLSIIDNSQPLIKGTLFDGNTDADGIQIDTLSEGYLIDGCTVNIPASKKAIFSSSEKNAVRVINGTFTSNIVENITSYVPTTAMGTNIKI
jgi:hypothetical protein